VAGQDLRGRPALLPPDAPHGDARRQHRGLGVVRQVQLLGRAGLDQLPEIEAERRGGLGEGLADQGVGRGKLGEHADRLRALAGEYEAQSAHRLGFDLLWFNRRDAKARRSPFEDA